MFGDTKTPGDRHARIAFSAARNVGAILVRGDVKVSVLKANATYPGNLTNESDWEPCERLALSADVQSTQQGGYDSAERYPYVALWVIPSSAGSAISTRAIRFTHTAARSDYWYAGHVRGVYVFNSRFANLAPQGAAATNVNEGQQAVITNEKDDPDGLAAYDWVLRWTTGAQSVPISSNKPVYLYLTWPSNVTLRGLGVLRPCFNGAEVSYYTGSSSTNPREAANTAWTTIGTWSSLSEQSAKYLAPKFYDFGSDVTTRSIRLKITDGTLDNSTNTGLAELFALKSMSTNALSTAKLSVSKTTPPVAITFTLTSAKYVTLVINDSNGNRVRNLVAETYFPAGTNTVYWDGLDESGRYDEWNWNYLTTGKLAPTGTYTVRGITRDALTLSYEFTPFTGPATSSWLNRDHTGGWMADMAPAKAALYLPATVSADKRVLIGTGRDCDLGNGLAWLDLSGNLKYGAKALNNDGFVGGDYLARDAGANKDANVPFYAITAFPTGNTVYYDLWAASTTTGSGTKRFSKSYTYASGSADSMSICGLAVRDTVAAISRRCSGDILMTNASTGADLCTNAISDARGLAFDSSGNLIAIVGTSVNKYSVNWSGNKSLTYVSTLVSGLSDPRGLCVDINDSDTMYVSDWGTNNQVRVYTNTGTFVRAIGTQNSGLGTGTYDTSQMHSPWGVTISDDGGTKRLWVMENDWYVRRVSVWSTTGTLVSAFHGSPGYGVNFSIDPTDRTRAYFTPMYGKTGLEFALDWTNGTWNVNRIYSAVEANAVDLPGDAPITPIYVNGQQYMINGFNPPPSSETTMTEPGIVGIWRMVNNVARPVAAAGYAHSWDYLKETQFDARWTAAGLTKTNTSQPVVFAWSDSDYDKVLDPSELTLTAITEPHTAPTDGSVHIRTSLGGDLTFYFSNGTKLAVSSYDANGVPLYNANNLASITASPIEMAWGGTLLGAGSNWQVLTGMNLAGYANGVKKWAYPNGWQGIDEPAYRTLGPNGPGELIGAGRLCGPAVSVNANVGDVWAYNGACNGQVFLFTTDGYMVGTLFQDRRAVSKITDQIYTTASNTAARGMDVTNTTLGFTTAATKFCKTSDGTNTYYYVVGGWEHNSIFRVDGLTSLAKLTWSGNDYTTVTFDATAQTNSADGLIAREKEQQQQGPGRNTMIVDNGIAPTVDGNLSEWQRWYKIGAFRDTIPSAEAARFYGSLAVSATTLYGAVKMGALAGNVENSASTTTDLQHIFHTGPGIILHLGANASADTTRTSPVLGDLRLFIARNTNGTLRAILFRQVASGSGLTPVTYTNAAGRSVTLQDVKDVSSAVTFAAASNWGDGVHANTMSYDYEFSIPLADLGWSPTAGSTYLGDMGIAMRPSYQSEPYTTNYSMYWNDKSQGTVNDDPHDAQLYPQTWGNLVVGSGGSATASYWGMNTTTKGSFWSSGSGYTYGAKGYVLCAWNSNATDVTDLKSGSGGYVSSVIPYGQSNYCWESGTSDVRGTINPATGTRNAGCWSTTVGGSPILNVGINLTNPTDGVTHRMRVYCLDWDTYGGGAGRKQQLELFDAVSGKALLDTPVTMEYFTNGKWAEFDFKGNVVLRVTNTGPGNAVISAITFDDASGSAVTPTATYVETDTSTHGAWWSQSGGYVFGTKGYFLTGWNNGADVSNLKADTDGYVNAMLPSGNGGYMWASGISDTNAPINPATNTRNAGCWYSGGSMEATINLNNPNDGALHRLRVYCYDYDNYGGTGRTQTVDVLNPKTGASLLSSTVSLSSFSGGKWVVIDFKGNIKVRVTNTGPCNAVISAITFDESPAIPTSDLVLWLKADAITGLSDGDAVASWTDSSSTGNTVTQSTTSLKPVYKTNILNGKPVVRFDGSDDRLRKTSTSSLNLTSGITMVVVAAKRGAGTSNPWMLWKGAPDGNGNGSYGLAWDISGSTKMNASLNIGGWADHSGTTTQSQNTFYRFLGMFDGSTVTMYRDGTQEASISRSGSITTLTGDFMVGGENSWANESFNGDVAEVLLYNRALNTTERQQVENYLADKYFVTNAAPTVSISSPTDGATFSSGANVTINATASDSDGTISKVEFYQGTTKLGEDSTSPYSYTWTSPADGGYSLTAKAIDDDSADTTSTAVSITVGYSLPSSGMVLWLKADAITGLSDGDAVASWTDSSSTGNTVTQSTTSLKPVYKTNILNGKPVVRFDGSDDRLRKTSTSSLNLTSGITMVVVAAKRGTGTSNPWMLWKGAPDGNGNGSYGLSWDLNSSTKMGIGLNINGWADHTGTNTQSQNTFYRFVGMFDGTNITMYRNGTQEANVGCSGSITTLTGDFMVGGENSWTNESFNGDIAEVVLYNRALSSNERQQVESYLTGKYGP